MQVTSRNRWQTELTMCWKFSLTSGIALPFFYRPVQAWKELFFRYTYRFSTVLNSLSPFQDLTLVIYLLMPWVLWVPLQTLLTLPLAFSQFLSSSDWSINSLIFYVQLSLPLASARFMFGLFFDPQDGNHVCLKHWAVSELSSIATWTTVLLKPNITT
jgi:hypothetical protein